MTLPKQMIQTAVRIIGDVHKTTWPHAIYRDAVGTGFFVDVPSLNIPNRHYRYLVTAAHIVKDNGAIEYACPNEHGVLEDQKDADDWRIPMPKLDLAVMPIPYSPSVRFFIGTGGFGLDSRRSYFALPIRMFYPTEDITELHLGGTVYFVGLLARLNRTMARSGTLGAIDAEAVQHKYKSEYICHLVDCRSYGGFSGSPCFYETTYLSLKELVPSNETLKKLAPVGIPIYRVALAGMLTEHLAPGNEIATVNHFGVGVMLRSQEILAVLMSTDLANERLSWDAEKDRTY